MQKRNSNQESTSNEPHHEEIALLAHSIFETEGCRDGFDIDHWLRAKDQLTTGSHNGDGKKKRSSSKDTPSETTVAEKKLRPRSLRN